MAGKSINERAMSLIDELTSLFRGSPKKSKRRKTRDTGAKRSTAKRPGSKSKKARTKKKKRS